MRGSVGSSRDGAHSVNAREQFFEKSQVCDAGGSKNANEGLRTQKRLKGGSMLCDFKRSRLWSQSRGAVNESGQIPFSQRGMGVQRDHFWRSRKSIDDL